MLRQVERCFFRKSWRLAIRMAITFFLAVGFFSLAAKVGGEGEVRTFTQLDDSPSRGSGS